MIKPESPEVLAVANEEGDHENAGSVAMRRAKGLDRQHVLVRSDVFLHGLDSFALKSLRRAVEHGLTPSALDFTYDDSIVVLRLTWPRAGEARGGEAPLAAQGES